jgi:hypothetical protein
LRPAGILFDRLMEFRYPADFAKLKRADWDRWVKRIDQETQAWLNDSMRWTPAVGAPQAQIPRRRPPAILGDSHPRALSSLPDRSRTHTRRTAVRCGIRSRHA